MLSTAKGMHSEGIHPTLSAIVIPSNKQSPSKHSGGGSKAKPAFANGSWTPTSELKVPGHSLKYNFLSLSEYNDLGF